jgi:hypothetical protein
MAKGTTLYTKLNLASEPDGYGSADPADVTGGSRRMHVAPTGIITFGEEWDLGGDRTAGVRNPIVQGRQTLTAESPTIAIEAPNVPTDELPYYFSMLQAAAQTQTNGGAKQWFFELGGQADVQDPVSMAALLGDGNLSLFANGIVLESLELSSQASGLTSLSASGFAKECYTTETAPAAPVPALPLRGIAGRVWQAKLWAAYPYSVEEATGTAFEHLYDWSLALTSGNGPINAQHGALTNAGVNPFAAPFAGTLSMTVASTPDTVAPFIDGRGGNIFVELAWGDAGSPAHAFSLFVAGIVSSVEPISGDQDGITTYAVEIALAYDPVTEKCLTAYVSSQADNLTGGDYID